MEAYHMTVRYILTCNYRHKIIPALKSRCHEFHIAKPDMNDFMIRAATVLSNENIKADPDTLDLYVRATYPDLRKCLNQLQANSITGTLTRTNDETSSEDALLLKAVEEFKNGRVLEGRQTLLEYISTYPTRIEDVYKWMYDNLDLWGKSNPQRDTAIIHIRNGLAQLPLVGIPEICLAATLIELTS
jgi:DNA polymerase III delta prime subunit